MACVRGFTPLCPTWAVFWLADLLLRYSGFHQRCDLDEMRGECVRVGMNRVVIEEHQVRDLVFAQVYYLYIPLKATSACVIVPIAKVPRTQDSSYQ